MTAPFSFSDHALGFDAHIGSSIPALDELRNMVAELSLRFVENDTDVLDLGCSTGVMLNAIRAANQNRRSRARYIGIDVVPQFQQQWSGLADDNLHFRVADVLHTSFERPVSFGCAVFFLQFIPEPDRVPLLRRIYQALRPGGAFILAEKILADSADFKDILTFPYYSFKQRTFAASQILDKERGLRGHMRCWTEAQWREALAGAGFVEAQRFWQMYLFSAWLVKKPPVILQPERLVRLSALAA
jgi:tRNA (cmo5U34)-methyltransferase